MSNYPAIRRALAGRLWYMDEQKLREVVAFLEFKCAGGSTAAEVLKAYKDEDDTRSARAARSQRVSASSAGSVAVIPVYGMITHRANMMSEFSGGTSTESLSAQIRQAVNDPNVKAIVMDIDSPGGDVDGVDELASEIYSARKSKSITAVSNCLCASAAYYLASQANEVVVSPSSLTGSIGVYTMHEDDSEMLANAGIKYTLIKYGENKAEGISTEPLSDSAKANLQEMVDTFGLSFEKAVARGRGVALAEVQKKFGNGRVFDAQKAVRVGMADRVGTLDDVLAKFGVKRTTGSAQAADEVLFVAADEAPAIAAAAPSAEMRRRALELLAHS